MKDEVTIEDLLISIASLWKFKVLIVTVTVFSILLGLLVTMSWRIDNKYCAITTIYSADYGSYQQSITGISAIQSYSDVLSSRKICDRAAAILSNSTVTSSTIQSMISAGYSQSKNVMKVYSYSPDPETAIAVANVVAESFVLEVNAITGSDSVHVLDEAQSSYLASNGQKKLLLIRLTFALAGLFLICLFLVIKELFSDKLRTLNKCEKLTDHKIIGVLPEIHI